MLMFIGMIYVVAISLIMDMNGFDMNTNCGKKLVVEILKVVTYIMLNIHIENDNCGIFSVYLKWLLQLLQNDTLNKEATECLMATCYQFTPKNVFYIIEHYMDCIDEFKDENAWIYIIKFTCIAIKEFSVDNFYVIRLLYLIHNLLQKCKLQKTKNECYELITIIYQQLGSKWRQICIGPHDWSIR
eukprot:68603_1